MADLMGETERPRDSVRLGPADSMRLHTLTM